MKRQAFLLVATMLAALVVGSGVALAATVQCKGNLSKLCKGTKKADTMKGTDISDWIDGLGGDDYIYGLSGLDHLYGGKGSDYIEGGNGNDFIDGEYDSDVIKPGLGDDRAFGSDGDDVIIDDAFPGPFGWYGSTDDYIQGGQGNDTINAWWGEDHLFGDDGNDDIAAINSAADVNGGPGNDKITLMSPHNKGYATGDVGDDVIDVADGDTDDIVWCGDGHDTVTYEYTVDSTGHVVDEDNVYDCEVKIKKRL